ncbi:hypothetical protein Bbelb_025040 [Branchiostoma belcheri]|nr:hypothetical protein Bbelb_025040 [Branchiostoma belcheri]
MKDCHRYYLHGALPGYQMKDCHRYYLHGALPGYQMKECHRYYLYGVSVYQMKGLHKYYMYGALPGYQMKGSHTDITLPGKLLPDVENGRLYAQSRLGDLIFGTFLRSSHYAPRGHTCTSLPSALHLYRVNPQQYTFPD